MDKEHMAGGQNNFPVEDMTNEQILELIERERIQAPDDSVDNFWALVEKDFCDLLMHNDECVVKEISYADALLNEARINALDNVKNIDKIFIVLNVMRSLKHQGRNLNPEERQIVMVWMRKIKEWMLSCRDVHGSIKRAEDHFLKAVVSKEGKINERSQ